MLSKTMQKKLTHHFKFQDLDRDNFVEQEDWENCAKNLAEMREWKPESAQYKELVQKHIQMWETFWKPADQDNDGKVSLKEYLELAEQNRGKGTFSLKVLSELFETIFSVLDIDGDKQIMLQDYQSFFKAWGIDEKLAEPAFSSLDFSKDDFVSKMMFVQSGTTFFTSDDPKDFGNLMFGPYEQTIES